MRTLIVYLAQFGNTRWVADAIAEMVGPAGEVRVVEPARQGAIAILQQTHA